MKLRRTKKGWKQVDTKTVPIMTNEKITTLLREAKSDISELHRRVDLLYASLVSVGEHHDEQHRLWADNGNADPARYHKERRDFALITLTAVDGA